MYLKKKWSFDPFYTQILLVQHHTARKAERTNSGSEFCALSSYAKPQRYYFDLTLVQRSDDLPRIGHDVATRCGQNIYTNFTLLQWRTPWQVNIQVLREMMKQNHERHLPHRGIMLIPYIRIRNEDVWIVTFFLVASRLDSTSKYELYVLGRRSK